MMSETSSSSSKEENINDESMSIIRECDDQQQTTILTENITVKLENQNTESTSEVQSITYELDEDECIDDDLPEGWIKCNHDSGMPVYLNEEMKVCSFSKPYFLGVNSLKNHNIPVANIPCLDYKLKLQKTNAENNEELNECPVTLSHEQYREYCSKIFKFKNIKFMRFSSWDKRREYIRMVKADRRRKDLPKLKDKSHLMSFPVQEPDVKSDCNTSNPEDQWTINLNGKSYVSILHEYIQRVLKTQPSYEFKELENARYPYLATVILDGMQYGIGIGSSKKQAKLDAARATLEILLPSVKNHIQINRRHAMNERQGCSNFDGDVLFDKLNIKDSRIPEFCAQAAESMPYDMLQICLKRNFGEDAYVKCEMQSMQSGSDSEIFYRCTMTVKEHSATVICKNKREGRQKGAQALLKVLHPHIKYFGSLLRLYSHQNVGSGCEKKLDEPGNQSPKPRSGPNYEILKKLRAEMSKL
ncbi:microprocessor complex subunit DGCR8-like [Metopolophium dirhodum]|uniref:microprocessor complex subunit DGCR8-like n=1 Tax=Metopolophium dirhodum TaxID=44670 RepID=UPI00298FB5A1|nr:microprocessor complex subunit DGCR8-like [Metopolophium dirhodum]XP_060876835.1 microprocessor complex subunit DGCR8-like [Metopolophium dirhodum]XP_060876836.1 microprocessor complex subunit DGCR8-like [Metopolophium dirhodum]